MNANVAISESSHSGGGLTASRITSVLRHWMWRLVSAVSGGLTVTGGACVIVANHSSHADTAALLAAARPALKAGRSVVIYPEGTRSTDGMLGEFRSGALRLARDCGVPIVPVAVTGTADVLPKGGRFSRAPMQVHVGAPIYPHSTSAPQLRARVIALRDRLLPRTADQYALVS
jgi:1-acyl-sn-glycerol-3-phosphate acyltransferase